MRRLSTRVRPGKEPDRRTKPKDQSAPARRTVKDLPREIQQQLQLLNRQGNALPPGFVNMADNSNTQFATLGLWVARKHGLPVDAALVRVNQRFRNSQNADGGWGYTSGEKFQGMSSSTMTCAGLLGLTVAHGVVAAQVLEKNPKGGQHHVCFEVLDILVARATGQEPTPFWDGWSRLRTEYDRRLQA